MSHRYAVLAVVALHSVRAVASIREKVNPVGRGQSSRLAHGNNAGVLVLREGITFLQKGLRPFMSSCLFQCILCIARCLVGIQFNSPLSAR